MKKMSRQQLDKIENWVYQNARDIEIAKWNLLFSKGTKQDLINELVKYQNADGGFGNGLESDILIPESSAIATGEAIFTAQDYGLDFTADWAKKMLSYLEMSKQDSPSFYESVPQSIDDYPHAPWWSYTPDTIFTPNPGAVFASVLIKYGTGTQKTLGDEITEACIDFTLTDTNYWEHDTYCLQRLYLALPTLSDNVIFTINNRISNGICFDESQWMNYVAQPFDMVDSPDSVWYPLIRNNVEKNADYWIDTLSNDGYWQPNFSWGVDTDVSKMATKNWIGYIAVKRIKILKVFDRIESI